MAEQMCYIAKDDEGSIVAAIMDVERQRKVVAKLVSSCIDANGTVERVPVSYVREKFGLLGNWQLPIPMVRQPLNPLTVEISNGDQTVTLDENVVDEWLAKEGQ